MILEVKPFRCRSCQTIFGETDGHRLYIGMAIFTIQTIMVCSVCGATGKWRPLVTGHGFKRQSIKNANGQY